MTKPQPETQPDAAPTPARHAFGALWTVPAASSAQVTFTSPTNREYVVHTVPDGAGAREASIYLTAAGTWSAVVSNGDQHAATVS